MQRRTFLQGMLALPLIGVAAKAFSGEKPKLQSPGVSVREIDESVVRRAFPQVTHVIFFDRKQIKQNKWDRENFAPIMVLREKRNVPTLVMYSADCVVDMKKMRCVKHRYDETLSSWTEEQHRDFALKAITRAYFHMGDKAPYELTDELRMKNGLAFANLRDSRTYEML